MSQDDVGLNSPRAPQLRDARLERKKRRLHDVGLVEPRDSFFREEFIEQFRAAEFPAMCVALLPHLTHDFFASIQLTPHGPRMRILPAENEGYLVRTCAYRLVL